MPENPNECPKGRCGRPRVRRCIDLNGPSGCYAPVCPHRQETAESVVVFPEEIAVLKLVDLDDLSQEEAAGVLGVSRKTAWRDLHEARRKIADALVNGKTIRVSGCPHDNSCDCTVPDRET
ncbi:DUF134 domain-containing protein [Methanocorpusculum vombati]|uniref:DUF134 domain-containing protein n=1 Tax=Methanocorpusculum vombati TaxID=3002864 RepID=A0ABT4IPD5_9EURY|nr:DUF134 domain-containing protein [Methanocorpusculum vombati]MCZ9320237.1 DUF134 domain-containing protein [Methanocorpusculum sp.]MCZ0862983.1 DUF134 domain-containing protein [Methanocorpusculum vombati]MDE2521346.1 DUF134 domain-containing protein [Methanocorpusculum sp.]MDE2534555.1 DUF134 domain-containing protein [Methanocorpusculum sp.]MDE2546813.1 DUF134 domain-containing protein [Methanocorpusculum sp.]